jgi:thiol-disulfide isomerase/thioredoxin
MSFRRVSLGSAWLLGASLYGCSGGTPAPAPPVTNSPPPAISGQVAPANPRNAVPPSTTQTPSGSGAPGIGQNPPAADPAKNETQELISQIKAIQAKQVQPRSRADLQAIVDQAGKIVDLSEKAIASKPDAADRDFVRGTALQAMLMLAQFDPSQTQLLERIDKLAEGTLADTPDGPLAISALFIRAVAHLNLEQAASQTDPAVTQRLFAMAKEFAEKATGDPRSGQLLFAVGNSAMSAGQNDVATEVLKYTQEHDPEGQFGKMAAGKLMLMNAIGKPPEIAGPTLEGSEFDIAQYKGKVVLVDFWATWCGPCVGELPNVKSVYEKYHEEGFEVLAVSFDNTKGDLAKFVKDRELPWPQIYFDEEGKRGWQNPLGQKYGISGIPATFLVDRQGNLQKIDVRGEMLEPAVVELLKGNTAPVAN